MIIKNITSKNKELIRDISLGIQNLLIHKLRSFLTMLGVVFGVGSVVAMLSVGEGASKAALDSIKKVGSNNIIISSMKSVEEQNITNRAESFMSVYGLKYADYERLKATFSAVITTVPVKLINKSGILGQRTLDLRVVGTTPEWFKLVKRDVVAGRVLVEKDSQDKDRSLVLTEYGARRLLATRNTIGQDIKVGGTSFRVVGIVKSSETTAASSGIQMPDQEVDAYIPIEVARFYFGDISIRETAGSEERKNVELEQIIVEVDEMRHVESTAKGIETMLETFHKKKDYSMSIPLALLRQAKATKRTFNIVLASIACISLLVGGIGIMNIMLASVTERTREIGIRRAIGAKKKQIITQFLIETVVLSTIGGIVGLFVGIFIPVLITLMAGMQTVITLVSIILPLFISVGIGIFFGLYPAFRAADVDPIIALRHE
jgi:putative ABC transport system permease protein